MYFDKIKKCFLNDDGSKLESSESIVTWSDRKYIKWLQDAVAQTGKPQRDNTHLWKFNKIQTSGKLILDQKGANMKQFIKGFMFMIPNIEELGQLTAALLFVFIGVNLIIFTSLFLANLIK